MLAKLTSKNQLTLPKSVTEPLGPVQYFEVHTQAGQIILTPVRIQRGDALRAKLAELEIDAKTIETALSWAGNKLAPAAKKTAVAKPAAKEKAVSRKSALVKAPAKARAKAPTKTAAKPLSEAKAKPAAAKKTVSKAFAKPSSGRKASASKARGSAALNARQVFGRSSGKAAGR
ncbi:AbrB/MazE/SpoVT family DNA-binding domain-containing protein [Paucibacter sp. DJ1R-11]|uniref:AbrB/MazE/SpoVT family DNA-binding domain-containing protein n=1 Tax=Paucibacter sp. DJ1R-11 TaxID=2893556 RepID=UPI0021E428BE|nr:AbrB/MazE/SpoVT family DNA-binding domain-containing protein [Paucibacter sp. DJ1R-11]MCV2363055.1 AbrB/MazE/SpoVT family DNA-binding domain-containing protein [Paucibacter sp. DJ1R-11]